MNADGLDYTDDRGHSHQSNNVNLSGYSIPFNQLKLCTFLKSLLRRHRRKKPSFSLAWHRANISSNL